MLRTRGPQHFHFNPSKPGIKSWRTLMLNIESCFRLNSRLCFSMSKTALSKESVPLIYLPSILYSEVRSMFLQNYLHYPRGLSLQKKQHSQPILHKTQYRIDIISLYANIKNTYNSVIIKLL